MAIFDEYVQGIVDAFFSEGNNWRERIGDANIVFISPETSTEFTAKWVENRRNADKKLGLFDYPNIKGTVAQDLQSSSDRYSITFKFTDYENNDLQARDFYAVAAREVGRWTVNHPAYGQLGLQLVSIEESKTANQGGQTTITTQWIEDVDADKLQTQRELAGLVDGQCSLVQLNSIEQFVATCDQSNRAFRAVVENTVDGIDNAVDFALSPLFAPVDLVSGAMTTVRLGIQGSIDAVLLPLSELAGQIQNLVNIPLLASQDTKARLTKYASLRSALTALLPGEDNSITAQWASAIEQRNNNVTAEVASVSALVAISQITLTSDDLQTRAQALDLAQQVVEAFTDYLTAYDAQQTALEDKPIEERYISSKTIYNDLLQLVNLTLQYLVRKVGDLKIERRITLQSARPTVEFCISEFHTIDEYDNFIYYNNLKGSEILWLPKGKEVVLYV